MLVAVSVQDLVFGKRLAVQARSGVCFGHSATAITSLRLISLCRVSGRLAVRRPFCVESRADARVWDKRIHFAIPGEDVVRRCSMARLSSQTSFFRKVKAAQREYNLRHYRITCQTTATPPGLLIRDILQLCSYLGRYSSEIEVSKKSNLALDLAGNIILA